MSSGDYLGFLISLERHLSTDRQLSADVIILPVSLWKRPPEKKASW